MKFVGKKFEKSSELSILLKNIDIGIVVTTLKSDKPKKFAHHIQELRSVILKSCFAVFLTTVLCYFYAQEIFTILLYPLVCLFKTNQEQHRFIYTHLTEAFITYLKTAFFAGFFISFPYIAFQVWQFIIPGLYTNERKFFKFLLFSTPLLFIMGACFAYFVVIPTAFKFFLSFETSIQNIPLQLETKISEYLSLIMRLLLAFGVCFQLPIVFVGLSWLGILKSTHLIHSWRYAIVGITVLSAMITPPDALSMILLALPMLFLYTVTIFILKKIESYNDHA